MDNDICSQCAGTGEQESYYRDHATEEMRFKGYTRCFKCLGVGLYPNYKVAKQRILKVENVLEDIIAKLEKGKL